MHLGTNGRPRASATECCMPRLLLMSTYPLTLKTFLLPFARHFRSRGWRVDALASGDMDCIAGTFDRVFTVDWSRNLFYPRTWFAAPEAVREIVASEGYDIVHVHTPVAAFAARYALRALRRSGRPKLIYTAHGFHFHSQGSAARNLPFLLAEKIAGSWTDHLVVMNREDEAAAHRYQLVPSSRLRMMPGIGVDLSVYSADVTDAQRAAIRTELRLQPDDPYLLCVAEFRAVKRHDVLLKAFAKTLASHAFPRLHLLLAGDGPLLNPTMQLAQELGVADRVRFLGFRDDVPVLLRAASALVLSSEREGLPRCVLEAMVAKIPVVATEARGTADLLSDGCGTLVPLNDPTALARAVQETLSNPQHADALASRAAQSVHRYDLRSVIIAHEQLYSQALAELTDGVPAVAA
jgi:glycosyltransferase involved in cell wall biosynthesis